MKRPPHAGNSADKNCRGVASPSVASPQKREEGPPPISRRTPYPPGSGIREHFIIRVTVAREQTRADNAIVGESAAKRGGARRVKGGRRVAVARHFRFPRCCVLFPLPSVHPTMLLRPSLPRLVGTRVTVLALIRRARKRNELSIILPWRENYNSVIRQLTANSDDKEFRSIDAARTLGKLETVHAGMTRRASFVFRRSPATSNAGRTARRTFAAPASVPRR